MSSVEIKNGLLVTMNERQDILENATIMVENDRIVDILRNGNKGTSKTDEVIDATGMVVLPGLVNCHVHTVQTLFRGITDNLELLPWLQKYIYPMESVMDADDVYIGSLAGYAEMIRSGTTTCADMQSVRHVDKAFQAAQEIGIRATIAKAMMDSESVPENLREETSYCIKESLRLIRQWNNVDNGRLKCMFGPRFIQGCSSSLLKDVGEIATKHNIGIHIHVAENSAELKQQMEKYKKSPIEVLHQFGLLGSKSLLVHCVQVNDDDMNIISNSRANVVHCPSSNLKLASGICDVTALLEKKINVTIGVDGAACNNNLDIFRDMRLAALLAKISKRSERMPTISAKDILHMVTIGGAKALGLDDKIGSIEKGKKADITIVNLRKLETVPIFNILDSLVYSAGGHNVETVIINGKIVLRNRQISTIDESNLILKSQLKADNIVKKSGIDIEYK